jgi:hypothetical protein
MNLDEYFHDEHLKDIAFDYHQIAELKVMRHRNIFSPANKIFNDLIRDIDFNRRRLIDDYKDTYHKTPNLEDAKRLFYGYPQEVNESRRESGDANYINPVFE